MSTSRRTFLRSFAALGAAAAVSPRSLAQTSTTKPLRVVVVGAGAFGGWSALMLRRAGAEVTLVDTWGPGNSRASSGGETRVIRQTYGADRFYTELAGRALTLWLEHQAIFRERFFARTGALWMVTGPQDSLVKDALPILRDLGIEHRELSAEECRKRYPQIDFDGLRWALWEPGAGYLLARQACQAVAEALVREGGTFLQAEARPLFGAGGGLDGAALSTGSTLTADAYLFACGPWLGQVFPDVPGARIRPTRQEVFFFGAPAGDSRFGDSSLPVWVEEGAALWYGIPGNRWRGFKVADDSRGPDFDPTHGERLASKESLAAARALLARRFPALRDAPLLESRVCQYENSADGHFVFDRHPRAENLWLLGGGSGHGFKFGPALGELVATTVLGKRAPEKKFSLARFG
ncbi:MAG TPA: FAD-dependent oxidoreductase [Thermoanaerobaculia bacterium]|nr:FAD-dependent oxidoreductase [Thermoanaerobaculia bacterium]